MFAIIKSATLKKVKSISELTKIDSQDKGTLEIHGS